MRRRDLIIRIPDASRSNHWTGGAVSSGARGASGLKTRKSDRQRPKIEPPASNYCRACMIAPNYFADGTMLSSNFTDALIIYRKIRVENGPAAARRVPT
jgi:hypothetical protein